MIPFERAFMQYTCIKSISSICFVFWAVFPAMSEPGITDGQRQLMELYVRQTDNFPTTHRWTTLHNSQEPLRLDFDLQRNLRYQFEGKEYTLDNYLERHPITALLVFKNGKVLYEKYQYGGSSETLFYSASIAKSFVGIAVAHLEQGGKILSQDVPIGDFVKQLSGTPLGEVTIRNHMRMGSGMKYSETYSRDYSDDHGRFVRAVETRGLMRAFEAVQQREVEQGIRFNYAGVSTAALSALVRAVSQKNAARYFGDEIWSKIGTEARAYWAEDIDGETWGYCCFLGRARDYLRLGIVLGNSGKRPDTGEQIIPSSLMVRLMNIGKLEAPFKPPDIKGGLGYDSQFWLSSRVPEAFSMAGLYGQSISVFPRSSLVVVHFAMTGVPPANEGALNAERGAMVAGLLEFLR